MQRRNVIPQRRKARQVSISFLRNREWDDFAASPTRIDPVDICCAQT